MQVAPYETESVMGVSCYTDHDAPLFSIPGWWDPQQDCLFLQAAEKVQRERITEGITRQE